MYYELLLIFDLLEFANNPQHSDECYIILAIEMHCVMQYWTTIDMFCMMYDQL